jgi:hypothetical protein
MRYPPAAANSTRTKINADWSIIRDPSSPCRIAEDRCYSPPWQKAGSAPPLFIGSPTADGIDVHANTEGRRQSQNTEGLATTNAFRS